MEQEKYRRILLYKINTKEIAIFYWRAHKMYGKLGLNFDSFVMKYHSATDIYFSVINIILGILSLHLGMLL